MNKPLFITGIDTGVGKTIVSALIVQALGTDYWKPVQAGDLESSDSERVRSLVARQDVTFHPETHRLTQPMSPHAAAEDDGVEIRLDQFVLPPTDNRLVIEGAGGLMVPLNDSQLMIDLMMQVQARVVIVSKNYLGSINHTLLTIDALKRRDFDIAGIIFCGHSNSRTESIVLQMSGLPLLARIPYWQRITAEQIGRCAKEIEETLREQL